MHFFKMTGSGNDFIMLDGRETGPGEWPGERIRAVCDRRHGVGADGLVILTLEAAAVRMTFFNSDGSEAAMCGNAALCSTTLATRLGMASADGMRLATRAGTFPTRYTGSNWQSALNLPDFPLPIVVPIALGPGEKGIWLATVGVPHLTILVEDVDNVDLDSRGRELRFHPETGPAGANANFVSRSESAPDGSWFMRTFERGVEGETLACGTGAVASAVALACFHNVNLPMELVSRGGRPLGITATIRETVASDVWLSGEGRLVFEGNFPT
ncbi:MAG: diaminopimelate epimerase [Gemmatimonadota bacterium]